MAYSALVLSGITGDTTGPVGYWRLGESSGTTADNAEGTAALDGTYTGSPILGAAGPSGIDGTAVNMNAAGYVEVADNASLDITGALTLEAWVYLNTSVTTDNRGVVGKFQGRDAGGSAVNERSYLLYVDTSNRPVAVISTSGASSGNVTLSTSSTMSASAWYHLVFTFQPSTAMRLYVNGSEVAALTSGVPAAMYSGAAPVWIGTQFQPSNSAFFLPGRIDEAAIYPAALSATRILAHYNAGISSLSIPVILHHIRQQRTR